MFPDARGSDCRSLFQCGFLDLHLQNLTALLIQLGRHGIQFCLDQSACLVDQVDCFIRQETVADVTVRKGCGCNEGTVGDFYAVINFVALF